MVTTWQERLEASVRKEMGESKDGAHDVTHVQRVAERAFEFAREERGNEWIAYAAGWLHDIVCLPKGHPEAKLSSIRAAARSREILQEIGFPEDIEGVCHAVHAHSFSANVETKTIEAKCVQDADRLEALGALGVLRVFYCSGMTGSVILDKEDPAGEKRALNDRKYALDHFVIKLFTLEGTMKTNSGRKMATVFTQFLREFRDKLVADQLAGRHNSGHFLIANACQEAGEEGKSLTEVVEVLRRSDDPYVSSFVEQLGFMSPVTK